MGRHNKLSKERKAKAREENKLPTAPLNDAEFIVARQEDRLQEDVLTNEMEIASGPIDEMAKDSGPENGTNGEAMETESTLAQLVKPEGAFKLSEASTVVELQHPATDAPQRCRVEGSNPIPNKGYSPEDSRTSVGKIRVAGGYGHQTSKSQVGDFKRIDSLGRQLSSILRHRAVNLGLKMQSDGYVLVNDLLSLSVKTQAGLPLNSHTVDDIKEAVKRDNKQRFGLREKNGQLLIRANQGHSIKTVKSEDLLRPILFAEEVPVCVHGTYLKSLDSIRKQGLKRMKRLHVHFATGLFKDKGVISGMQSSCEVLIHLNVQKYLEDGMKLYCSENGVILAEGKNGVIPPYYFAKIERVKS